MDSLNSQIKSKIKGKAVIVGIGNPLRGDDGFGPKLIEGLGGEVDIPLFDCGTAPENYIIPILRSDPETIIIVDTVDFGKEPGTIGVFGIEDISNTSLSTHTISPRLIADLLKIGNDRVNIFMVAVQPKSVSFGENLSKEIQDRIGMLQKVFVDIFAER